MQSVGPSGLHTRFHLGFPKSCKVKISSYALAFSLAHLSKNGLIVRPPRAQLEGPGRSAGPPTPFSEKATGAQRSRKAKSHRT